MQMFQVTTSTRKGTLTMKVLNASRQAAVKQAIEAHRAKTGEPTSVHVGINGVEVIQPEVAMVR